MKLLLDENLSRRLVPFLQPAYPDSSQVALLGLEQASDRAIWNFARDNDYVIVTKDADYYDLSLMLGTPPYVIWLQVGNAVSVLAQSSSSNWVRTMHRLVEDKHQDIDAICRRFDVRRLEVFGSAARGVDFQPDTSDVDFLVEFDPASRLPPLDGFFGLQAELCSLLGRPVDLVEAGAVRNPYVLASIERNREVVYAA